jgi:hypothetical protein
VELPEGLLVHEGVTDGVEHWVLEQARHSPVKLFDIVHVSIVAFSDNINT